MKYATDKTFGGQRASLGRTVILVLGGAPYAGVIAAINEDDTIQFRDLDPEPGEDRGWGTGEDGLMFVDVKTEADLLAAPNRSWCWPPPV